MGVDIARGKMISVMMGVVTVRASKNTPEAIGPFIRNHYKEIKKGDFPIPVFVRLSDNVEIFIQEST